MTPTPKNFARSAAFGRLARNCIGSLGGLRPPRSQCLMGSLRGLLRAALPARHFCGAIFVPLSWHSHFAHTSARSPAAHFTSRSPRRALRAVLSASRFPRRPSASRSPRRALRAALSAPRSPRCVPRAAVATSHNSRSILRTVFPAPCYRCGTIHITLGDERVCGGFTVQGICDGVVVCCLLKVLFTCKNCIGK